MPPLVRALVKGVTALNRMLFRLTSLLMLVIVPVLAGAYLLLASCQGGGY